MMSASAVTAKESRASIWLAGVSCADGMRSAGTPAAAGKGRKTVPACPRTLLGAGFDEIAAAVSVARPAAMRSTPSLRPLKVNYVRSRAGQHDLNQSVRCAFGQRADALGADLEKGSRWCGRPAWLDRSCRGGGLALAMGEE